ncbi:MAG: hypothetical protein QF682_10665 [Candidatus Thermoplasmatota archaeon]|nr:hypothetical protein [Candidatus Thermoplasmatota archaeon]
MALNHDPKNGFIGGGQVVYGEKVIGIRGIYGETSRITLPHAFTIPRMLDFRKK